MKDISDWFEVGHSEGAVNCGSGRCRCRLKSSLKRNCPRCTNGRANKANGKGEPEPRPSPPAGLNVEQLQALKVMKPQMLIERFIPTPGAVLMVAPHKTGKTVVSAQAAIAVASGHALFDNYS